MTRVFLTDPSLVLLVGAAGVGKSTFAARHFAPDEVLSSDAFRALISGDEANQAVSRVAFAALHRTLDRRLAAGLMTVVDATNADRRSRLELVGRARRADVPAVAIVLALPDAVVLARNAGRARRVDEAVVRLHIARVRAALAPEGLATEGYASIWIARTAAEVEALGIVRLPAKSALERPIR